MGALFLCVALDHRCAGRSPFSLRHPRLLPRNLGIAPHVMMGGDLVKPQNTPQKEDRTRLDSAYEIRYNGIMNDTTNKRLPRCEVPGCLQLSTEFYEVNDDEGANVCLEHLEAILEEIKAKRQRGPSLTDHTPTPLQNWLEQRPWE